MKRRTIRRIAQLQEFRNRPESVTPLVKEVARKGYHGIATHVRQGQEVEFAELAAEADRHGLQIMALVAYMKYEAAYLKDHPEQRLVRSGDAAAIDQDGVVASWGCPFHPRFLDRYLKLLERLGRIPNLTIVCVNDEAYLGTSADNLACYCPSCQQMWRDDNGGQMPRPPFDDRDVKTTFIRWQLQRWAGIHAQMKEAVNRDHRIEALFTPSPTCLFALNPWVSGVDFSLMLKSLDGVMTGPYHTFHGGPTSEPFKPDEVYLSECARSLAGMTGANKTGVMTVQGFSHPTFTRPLGEADGWWTSVVPLALGINAVKSYVYTLQKNSPVQKPYEDAARLDAYFERTRPVDFAAVIDSLETQCFDIDVDRGMDTWRCSRMTPTGELLRHAALPHVYLPSAQLEHPEIDRWPVLVLPGVSCLSAEARRNLRRYVENGGLLVAMSETATRDENGTVISDTFLADVFGVDGLEPTLRSIQFTGTDNAPEFANLPWPDDITGRYMGGAGYPVLALEYAVNLHTRDDVEILARENDNDAPVIVTQRVGKGRAMFVSGIAKRLFFKPDYRSTALNFAGRAIAQLIAKYADDALPVRAKQFPPVTPMMHLRPMDVRNMPTAEVLPCVGDDLTLVTIPSYFRESMTFRLEAKIPDGKSLTSIRELVSDTAVNDIRTNINTVEIDVTFTYNDFLKVYAFNFS